MWEKCLNPHEANKKGEGKAITSGKMGFKYTTLMTRYPRGKLLFV
jgi:hypothetical protein